MTGLSLTQKVMIGTALLGGMSGVIGSFAVLRRRSLVGDMLAHSALPGVCLAYLITQRRDLLGLSIGALISGLLAITAVTIIVRWTRTKEDAAIGIVLSTFFGMGVVLLSVIQKPSVGGNKAGLDSYIFGEPGNMLSNDLLVLGGVAIAIFVLVFFLYKEFQIVTFDTDFAQSQGWPTMRLDLTLMAALTVVTIVGLPIVGVILMAAMLILPAATARFWTNHLHVMLILAGLFGMVAGILGTQMSPGLGAGATIVLTAAAMFLISLLFAPERGIVARILAEVRLKSRIAREHLLRSLYEINEPNLPDTVPLSFTKLEEHRHWMSLPKLLKEAAELGFVVWDGEDVHLTSFGLKRSAELTKNHRLWEMYLMQYTGLAADHVDRRADEVEHVLPPALLSELEQKLAAAGRLPPIASDVPESPHSLKPESSKPDNS